MNENQNGMIKATNSAGELIVNLVKLQFFWFFGVLKGGILLGIFPATATVIQALFSLFEKKELPAQLFAWFNKNYKVNFRHTNILGWIEAAILLVVWFDLKVSGQLLKNQFIHVFLLILMILVLLMGLFLFPVYLRYEMRTRYYFKQAFLLAVSSFLETLAIIIGVAIVTIIGTALPILVVVALVPMVLLPVSWFSLQAMLKIEKKVIVE